MKIYVCLWDDSIEKAVMTEDEAIDWLLEQMVACHGSEEEFVEYYNKFVDVVDEIDCAEDANKSVIMNIAPDYGLWYVETNLDSDPVMYVLEVPAQEGTAKDLLPLGAPEQKRSWAGGKIRKL